MTAVIEIKNLTKFYGAVRGVEDVDLTVYKGEIFGFLGPNGSGKSTTIRVLVDMLRPTSGSISVFGLDSRADSIEIHRRIGYLPGELAMYDRMTARQMLGFFASIRGLEDLSEMHTLAERFDLDLDRPFRSYSSGNRQKVGLVHAFMATPELIILDEPSSALDPLMQQEFYALLGEVKDAGRTVFLSSHVLPEVERVADRVAIIRQGRLVATEHVADLKARARRSLEVTFEEAVPAEHFAGLSSITDVRPLPDGRSLAFVVVGTMDELVKVIAKYRVRNISSSNGNLEDVFLEFYAESRDDDVA
ncbi:putative ABC transporter ATP-binding protein YbhF [bacterium BMS3Bbin02]|nr:putative ABC transporter ATP-binding protein YbhF [bacterium BMS3Bbin02]